MLFKQSLKKVKWIMNEKTLAQYKDLRRGNNFCMVEF